MPFLSTIFTTIAGKNKYFIEAEPIAIVRWNQSHFYFTLLYLFHSKAKYKHNTYTKTMTLKKSMLLEAHRTGMNFPNKCSLPNKINNIIIIIIIIIIRLPILLNSAQYT